jgi:hypothetical protein
VGENAAIFKVRIIQVSANFQRGQLDLSVSVPEQGDGKSDRESE